MYLLDNTGWNLKRKFVLKKKIKKIRLMLI